jgi:raffinose/stachyose/melibiose transport system substrate-binding protein
MKRALSYVALAVTAGLALAGCSDASSGSDATVSETSVNPTGNLSGVHLTFWTAQNSVNEPKQAIDAFEKATGAVIDEVVVPDLYEQNLPTKLASGEKPDLAFWQPSISTLPFIQPANNLLPLDNETWVSKLGKIEQGLGVIGGKRYAAIVTSPAVLGVYYNKAVFAKAGITEMPTSYDDMIAKAKIIKEKTGAAPFFEVGGDKWPLQWNVQIQLSTLGNDFWSKLNANQEKWTNPTIVNAITKYKTDIFDAGLAQDNYKTATFVDQGSAIYDGTAAMALNVTSFQTELQATHSTADLDKNIGWFPISAHAPTAFYSPDQTNGLVAFKTGDQQKQDAARQFMAFWLGPDYPAYIAANHILSVEPGVQNPAGLPEVAQKQGAALDTAFGVFQAHAIVAPDLHLGLADMIYGKKSPQEVAQYVQDEFTQVAKAQGAAGF